MRIELDDTPQPLPASLTQTLIRVVLAAVTALHAAAKYQQPSRFAAELARFQLPEVDKLTTAVIALEVTIAGCLLLGRFTRVASFLLLCDLAGSTCLLFVQGQLLATPVHIEAVALTLACGVFFMVVGSGPLGLDYILRRRARLRAIARDELWNRYPYVANG
ncbi:MAG: DoxX family membrane protein [Polyangiales bacterium]